MRAVAGAGSINPVWPIINAYVLDGEFRRAAAAHKDKCEALRVSA